jgi:enamine deaminase RidA (YjgF/YER057c/UK114 family)
MATRMNIAKFALAAALLSATAASPVQAQQVVKLKSNPAAIILDAADVKAGADMIFVSGQLPSPVDPAMPMTAVKSIEDLGDTKTQTISVLGKIKAILASRGYTMADVIKLSLFLAPDPKLGKLDFAGANEGFKQFFGTAENPTTTARSTFQVGALVGPYYLIEIEAIAAKAPKK